MSKDLTEIRQKIEDYTSFLDDLQEITDALETNSGLGLFLQSESQDVLENTYALSMINNHDALKRIRRHYYKERDPVMRDYISVLLCIWAKTNAKIGEISFLLETSIGQLEREEQEALDAMECHESSLHMGDYINEPQ